MEKSGKDAHGILTDSLVAENLWNYLFASKIHNKITVDNTYPSAMSQSDQKQY